MIKNILTVIIASEPITIMARVAIPNIVRRLEQEMIAVNELHRQGIKDFIEEKLSPYLHLQLFSFLLLPLLKSLLVYFSGFYLYSRHTPTYKEVVQPPFLYPLLEIYFFFTFLVFFVKSEKCVTQICLLSTNRNFQESISFFQFSLPHIVYLLFVYPETYFLFTP